MRVVRHHTSRALDAVRRQRHRRHGHVRRHQSVARPGSAVSATSPLTIDAALRIIEAQPAVRIELVDAASARLAAGDRPTSEQIADMAIRRATCDALC
jgi:hypothetical protein